MSIEQELKSHLILEGALNGELEFLDEGLHGLVLEEYGIFPGCIALSGYIIKKTREAMRHKPSLKTVFFNFKNSPFLGTAEIRITDKYDAAYSSAKTVFKEGKLYPAIFLISAEELYEDSAVDLIAHELTHAYQDWCRMKKGLSNSWRKDIADGNYKNDEIGKSRIGSLLYLLNRFEEDAYMAQIAASLKRRKQYFGSVREMMDYLKTLIPYKNYLKLFKYIEECKTIDDKKIQEEMLAKVSELSNFKFGNYNKFLKWLDRRCYRIKNRFERYIPKILYQNMISKNKPRGILNTEI